MKLAQLQVKDFADLLASDAPAPGGGSAAALEAGLGAALTAMVCNLTTCKEKFAEYKQELTAVEARAQQIKAQLVDVMDRDTEAFNAVSAAFALPKSTDEEKNARSAAIQSALEGCTKTPMEAMELAAEALELTAKVLPHFNETAASDLGVAALSLRAGICGAWLNVKINIGGLKNRAFAEDYRVRGEALLEKALPLADRIYEAVLEKM